jgi:LEA14-like dessication related protein
MKRFLAILSAALLLAACHDASRDPVIKGYKLEQVSGLSFSSEGMVAEMDLVIDVENPSSATYSVESLEATLYKGMETARFAEATLKESVSIPPRSEQAVNLPLHVRLLRPLSLLSDNQALELSNYCADIDMTIKKGSISRRIQRERVPLSSLEQLLGTYKKQQTNEAQ